MPASTRDGLPGGVDDMLERRFGPGPQEEPDVLSALVAIVDPRRQGEGLSAPIIEGMRRVAAAAGFAALIAPVRPTWKDALPADRRSSGTSHWAREDGLPFDPWIRLHVRLGARARRGLPASRCAVTGTVAEWEEWTGMQFPGGRRLRRPRRARPGDVRRRPRRIRRSRMSGCVTARSRLARPETSRRQVVKKLVLGVAVLALALAAAGAAAAAAASA